MEKIELLPTNHVVAPQDLATKINEIIEHVNNCGQERGPEAE